MKKVMFVALFFAAIGLLSFTGKNVTTHPLPKVNKFAKPSTVDVNLKVPTSIPVFISCAAGGVGEMVLLEGDLHILMSFNINGNNVSGKFHFQPQGISGTGLTTGAKYQATGGTQGQFKGSLQNGQYEETFVNNFRIIGQGPGNNFLVHQNAHITVNSNGNVTATVDNVSAECK